MSQAQNKGFTLIELLVVIAIIGILSSVVMSSANSARTKAKIAKAEVTVNQIRKAIAMLEGDTGKWPGGKTIEDVESGASGNEIWDLSAGSAGLVVTDGSFSNWKGPYISSISPDPWENNYFFDTDYDIDDGGGTTWGAVVGSFGPNGNGQNVYDSDNIYEALAAE